MLPTGRARLPRAHGIRSSTAISSTLTPTPVHTARRPLRGDQRWAPFPPRDRERDGTDRARRERPPLPVRHCWSRVSPINQYRRCLGSRLLLIPSPTSQKLRRDVRGVRPTPPAPPSRGGKRKGARLLGFQLCATKALVSQSCFRSRHHQLFITPASASGNHVSQFSEHQSAPPLVRLPRERAKPTAHRVG